MMKKSAFMKALMEVVGVLLKDDLNNRSVNADSAAVYARGRKILSPSDTCPDDRNPVVAAALSIYREALKSNRGVSTPALAQLRLQMEVEKAWEHYEEQSKPKVNQHD